MVSRTVSSCLSFLFLLLLPLPEAQAQQKAISIKLPALIPYRAGNLWGYADSTGTLKIKPQFRRAEPFQDGLAQVTDNYVWGLIDEKGNLIIKPQYQEIHPFANGLALVTNQDRQQGVVNRQGEEIIPAVYKYVSLENLADLGSTAIMVSIEKMPSAAEQINRRPKMKLAYGLFSGEGKRLLPVEYSEIIYLGGGLFRACIEEKCTVVNMAGETILPLKVHRPGFLKEDLLVVCSERKCGFINKTGKEVIPPKFNGARDFSEGLAAAVKDGKWGFINKEGKMVIAPTYDLATHFQNGLAIVAKGQAYGLIDKKGKELTDFIYTRIYYSEGSNYYNLQTKDRNLKGFYNAKTGKLTIPASSYQTDGYSDGLAVISKELNKVGYINEAGTVVIPEEYEAARMFYKGRAAVRKKGFWGVIDKTGKMVLPFVFTELEVLDADLFKVGTRSGWNGATLYGLVNSQGEEIAPLKYTRIDPFQNGLALAQQNHAIGIIDLKGKEVIPPLQTLPNYQFCGNWENGLIKLCSGNREKDGYIDRYGKRYFTD
ncbi:WG repeat-containing protein [Adhaeribacter soli]|uniref:WG repeat-containing protein n=1 Tax=Adhaeribacter soli TaxID=2607655 RepID=A0A5N1J3T8_9BACT|nr:WG repeat-containing protein [Adhaeribacter soli]KAA9345561.1 WG repeat-containing protein [Adhaeribacter soli]